MPEAEPPARRPPDVNVPRPAGAPRLATPSVHRVHRVHRVAASPATVPVSALDQLFGRVWPEQAPAADLRPVAGALAVGVLAGALMTFSGPGLSWAVVLMLAGLCAWLSSSRRLEPFTLACSLLAAGLVAMLAVRAAEGLAVLAVLAAAGVFLAGVTGARTFRGFLLSGIAWPTASLRGLPWFGRTLRLVGARGRGPVLARTRSCRSWASRSSGCSSPARTGPSPAGWTRWSRTPASTTPSSAASSPSRSSRSRWARPTSPATPPGSTRRAPPGPRRGRPGSGWRPLLVVDLVFLVFVVAQARVVLGGHDYVRRTAGLSYADYAHQGFGQLVVATALTLLVIWAAGRRVGPGASDRRLFRVAAGLLGVLALAVVASALARMAVYQDAYGFTTLRLVVTVFEGWLGLVVLAVLVLGVLGLASWVPRLALLTGATALLGLLVLNPDAWVAERNIDRYQESGWLDAAYLGGLSDDAVPVLVERLPADLSRCVLAFRERTGDAGGGRGAGCGRRWDPDWTWGATGPSARCPR